MAQRYQGPEGEAQLESAPDVLAQKDIVPDLAQKDKEPDVQTLGEERNRCQGS